MAFKLNVIIPCYNEKSTIQTVIANVQSVEPINKKIIIVDDFSNDGSKEILKSYETYSDIEVVYHDKNFGKGKTPLL